ncbi:hypothetical protein GJ688_04375 [Heliobacillus mobilis]|uniref:Methyl-accepting transducer domain-containing protein n=1 Tax=Heliobacterium mobile TaxID=28064 RepID=A0A6I3SH97_HELMO|nr:methyl-accepting chemotaxis protein [Heliobacterium mobile]MTV48220.1 hypothetical protein [Heliobacterium mobile]
MSFECGHRSGPCGNHGRGFAVVAEEVRKLAEESQLATKKIATLIGEIQRETVLAVQVMSEGTREVREGTEIVNRSGRGFMIIAELIGKATPQLQEVFSAIQEMAEGSQHIVTSMGQVFSISKDTAARSQAVAAAVDEQSAAIQEISASATRLNRMAERLQNTVDHFRM